MTDWETQKKALLPYLQRAAEIEAVDPKVAYYCRLYAVEQGIKLEQRDQKADDLLELVLNQLEKDKPHLVLDTAEDLEHCERFALGVYIKAKRRDEQGIADRDTAKAYYAAFNFIEILKQFGQLSPEVEKERRFAVFRAAEIKRHLDEGRDPPPLQPQGDRSPTSSEPPPKKEAAPPLIDYDPGYVVGSKVVFIDADTRLFRKGVIQGKAQEVGGFFKIDAENGNECQLGALFLAPDLSEGGEVIYFFSDGRQMNAVVTQMKDSEWPPLYTLKLEDGTAKTVNHSNFILNSGPITEEEQNKLTTEMEVEITKDDASVTKSETEEQPLRKRESWLIPKTASRKTSQPVVPTNQPFPPPPPIPSEASFSPVLSRADDPSNESPFLPKTHAKVKPQRTLSSEQYYTDGYEKDYFPKLEQSPSKPKPVTLNDPQTSYFKPNGFEPDNEAIEKAMKSTHKATNALNFCEVDLAIQCLQDALKYLTRPPSK